ncbi:M10 family metallopeptidase C-terminal domain-containing protein [Aliiroseovarius marinus]|uniref:M10 family metallopeptidase C-terminal domain-containing protein n=1 Tax=Aliiroseovarius marinus TaxID=2500159 RepID=UPI003D7EB24F
MRAVGTNALADGGAGDDEVVFEEGADAIGGNGSDTFYYIAEPLDGQAHEISTIQDFDPAEDHLEIQYISGEFAPEMVFIFEDWADGQGANVLINGELAIRVAGGAGLTGADVTFIT